MNAGDARGTRLPCPHALKPGFLGVLPSPAVRGRVPRSPSARPPSGPHGRAGAALAALPVRSGVARAAVLERTASRGGRCAAAGGAVRSARFPRQSGTAARTRGLRRKTPCVGSTEGGSELTQSRARLGAREGAQGEQPGEAEPSPAEQGRLTGTQARSTDTRGSLGGNPTECSRALFSTRCLCRCRSRLFSDSF